MKYNQINRKCESEESDLDFPPEEISEEAHAKLILVNKILCPGKNLLSPSSQTNEKGGKSSEESEDELYTDSQGEQSSSLVIYFKTVSKFPLLNEKEERILAKRIEESKEKCKHLVIKWKYLFKNEFLRMFSAKHKKEIGEKLQLLNGSLHLFDDLVKLEGERRKIDRALKRRAHSFKTHKRFQEGLYKVESEISKCIAKISLSKALTERILKNLEEIPNSKKYTKKRQIVEQELRRILRGTGELSKEIKELKSELVQANQRLVISIAKKYAHHGLALPDLIQEGNLGLIRAIDTFDYRRGHRFITYATWWIRQAIIRALDYQSRTIRTPVYMNEKLNKIVKASNRLQKEYKRKPTLEEIAQETDTSLEAIEKVVQSFKDPISMHTLMEEQGKHVITPSLNYETTSILEQVILSNFSQIINVILSDLTPREKEMVKLRFGIGVTHDHTLEEIGERFNLSRERVRQILEVALNKLRNPTHMMQLKDFMDFN